MKRPTAQRCDGDDTMFAVTEVTGTFLRVLLTYLHHTARVLDPCLQM